MKERIFPDKRQRKTGMRTRVVINGRFLTQTVTGVQRFARETVLELDRLLGRGELRRYAFQLVHPRRRIEPLPLERIETVPYGKLGGHSWEQCELPRFAERAWLLNLCNTGPLFHKRQLVVMHDAAVFAQPGNYSFAFRTWYRLLQRQLARRAACVLTVSDFSRRELQTYCGIPEAKLRALREGHQHLSSLVADPQPLQAHGLKKQGYALAVGSLAAAKNIAACVTAFSDLTDTGLRLAIAGREGDGRIFKKTASKRANGSDEGKALRLGYVSDAQLKALYEQALCLVFPSRYEGCGLPPLEAMACGCPVIVSDRASLPEICGEAALYCDPDQPRQLAGLVRRLTADSALRETMRAKGKERASLYSWNQSAQLVIQALDEVTGT